MQKIMLCLKRPADQDSHSWNMSVANLAKNISARSSACYYTIKDDDVKPAHLLELKYTDHPNDAVINFWSEHAYELDHIYQLAQNMAKIQAYGVMESSAIPYEMPIGRVTGMCQVAFIKKPAAQSRQDWLDAWLGDHTRVAIDTQSNFGYRQNVVAVPLPLKASREREWPLMDAIVEENFPAIAMTSREAFFDAEDNPEKFEEHQQIMMQSCFKFIDFEVFDCVPMSQYVMSV